MSWEVIVVDEVEEQDRMVERVGAIDVAKGELKVCIRVPGPAAGRRRQEVRTYAATTRAILQLADWIREQGVTLVVMEATGDYWKPPFYLLEDEVECWLLDAKQVKNLPGRPKTDREDAIWLAKVAERGMARPSFVPPKPIRRLRDLCRYRRALTQERTREKQRVEKVLEDAQIKLSSFIRDIHGVSGRQMIEALIGGERDAKVLAQMARGRMRVKIRILEEALTGQFGDHHAYICRMMLDNIDRLSHQIDELTAKIDELIAPFEHQVNQLDEVVGIGRISAQDVIAEIGVDMTRFRSAAHLVSWAKFCPQVKQSGAKKPTNSHIGKGNPWLAGALGEIAIATSSTHSFLGARYRRLARRRGNKKALVAVGNSVLTIVWHLLSQPGTRFRDLGPDFYDTRIDRDRHTRNLARQLQHLTGQTLLISNGQLVIAQPAGA
jgi:transposase